LKFHEVLTETVCAVFAETLCRFTNTVQSCWGTICCWGRSLGDEALTSIAGARAPAAPTLATGLLHT